MISSNIWIFNIGAPNWEVCVAGPDDPSEYGKDFVGKPWHGVRPVSKVPVTQLEPGDLILARRTKAANTGVKGIWEYRDRRDISSEPEKAPWDDEEYQWLVYCDPIQRELPTVFQEDWEEIKDRLNLTSTQAATAKIMGAISSLEPELTTYYLENLLNHEGINETARTRLASELNQRKGTPGPEVLPPDDDLIRDVASRTNFPKDSVAQWLQALSRKQQIIFYGPPGTGKTHLAEQISDTITSRGDGFSQLIQFHQSYEYEDFIQGIRPATTGGSLTYHLSDGTFLQFCDQATSHDDPCVLIVDEINRADVASVFGELMYLLEYRDKSVQLAQHRAEEDFAIPENVYLIGTMNTADRSIALVDYALRRRFAMIPIYPDYDILRAYHDDVDVDLEELIEVLEAINDEIGDRQFEVGFTYFLVPDLDAQLRNIWQLEIEPYLEEYFVDDPTAIAPYRWDAVSDRLQP